MFWIGLAFLYLVSFLLVIFAKQIVAWHAKRYSRHDARQLDVFDRLQVFNPLSKYLIGKISNYATRGPQHPEELPRMIWYVRLLGLIPAIGYTIMLIYAFLIKLMSG